MNERLHTLVKQILDGGNDDLVGVLPTGERCFVALAANRYDLLPSSYTDPIEAWHQLDRDFQIGICVWRGWPRHYMGVGQMED